jgi:phage antirepressor YoqD-like protein
MSILQRYDNDGIELIINTQTGESFASQAGYARMSGVDYGTVRKRIERIKGGDKDALKIAEIPTAKGIQGVTLITEDLIAEWLPKDNPTMASQLMKLGVRVFLHKMAGYEVQTTAVQHKIPQTYAEALLEAGRLALENERLSAKIEQDAPLVSYAEAVQCSDDAIEVGEFAKLVGWGRNRLFRVLRDMSVIMQTSTLPYQRFIDGGYFEIDQEISMTDGKLRPYARITGKGQVWLKQKIDAHLAQQKQFASLIVQGSLGF